MKDIRKLISETIEEFDESQNPYHVLFNLTGLTLRELNL